MKRVSISILFLLAIFCFGIPSVKAQDNPLKIVTNHPDFKIKVQRCAASGKTVIIDLILTNKGINDVDDIEVSRGYYDNAEMYDDEGNIYKGGGMDPVIRVRLANDSEYKYNPGHFKIPADVPIRLSVRIEGVSTSTENIARLSLPFRCDAWGLNDSKPVIISNIPISRD